MDKDFKKLCTPARIYFILSVLSCIIAFFNGVRFLTVGINLIIAFIWTAVLGWFCRNGFTNVSWLLVLFPYFMMLFVFFGVMSSVTNNPTVMMVIPPSAAQQMM